MSDKEAEKEEEEDDTRGDLGDRGILLQCA